MDYTIRKTALPIKEFLKSVSEAAYPKLSKILYQTDIWEFGKGLLMPFRILNSFDYGCRWWKDNFTVKSITVKSTGLHPKKSYSEASFSKLCSFTSGGVAALIPICSIYFLSGENMSEALGYTLLFANCADAIYYISKFAQFFRKDFNKS